jgi:hypothetical protein
MKKISIIICLFLTAFSFQCSDTQPKNIQEFTGLSPEVKDRIKIETSNAMARISASLRSKGKKVFATRDNLKTVINEYRNTLTDEHKKFFDAINKDSNVRGLMEWSGSKLDGTNTNGRVSDTFWDESQVLAPAAKTLLATVQADIDYYMDHNSYGLSTPQMISDIDGIISYYISLIPYDGTLTTDEKNQVAASLEVGLDSVPQIMMDLDDEYQDQRTQFNWTRFGRKVGSVVLHVVVCAFVVVVAAAIIVASGGAGAAALLAPTTIFLGSLTLNVAAVGLVYGAEAGALLGVGAAFFDQCLQLGNLNGVQYESC